MWCSNARMSRACMEMGPGIFMLTYSHGSVFGMGCQIDKLGELVHVATVGREIESPHDI